MKFHRRIVRPAAIEEAGLVQMYALLSTHYDCVTRPQFLADLLEKTAVILLQDAEGAVRGFSTQQCYPLDYEGETINILFSGDTIVDPACWGSQELVRGWCEVAADALREGGGRKLYWFLISKGYRTYLYLPLFFKRFFPQPRENDAALKQLLDSVASAKFGAAYHAPSGLIRLPRSQGQLNGELAGIPGGRREDEAVRFFLSQNPDYASGVELACLARVEPENTHGLGRRLFLQAMNRSR